MKLKNRGFAVKNVVITKIILACLCLTMQQVGAKSAYAIAQALDTTPTLEQTLKKYDWPVKSAAFSPDGTKVVTTSFDGTTRIWNKHRYEERIKTYFSNNMLPLAQQALLVTFDALAHQKKGAPIHKSDLFEKPENIDSAVFTGIPPQVQEALTHVYHIDKDVFDASAPTC